MKLLQLSLRNFRNFPSLDIELPYPVLILQGDNAQGKTNFLEAIYLLALTRSFRTNSDRELISWQAKDFTRLKGEVERGQGRIRIEIFIQPKSETEIKKTIKVNGLQRRALEVVSLVNVVLFTAQDIELVGGSPALRRRYLDVLCSQLDSHYLRSLQHYQRVLEQRNHLLRLIQEKRAKIEEMEFWDKELVGSGSYLILVRWKVANALKERVKDVHYRLTDGKERLEISYLPSLGQDALGDIKGAFIKALEEGREKEINLGMTLYGPHRDEMRFLVSGIDMGIYSSRGQARTIAISLKLAEGEMVYSQKRDYPIFLLDDVLSELDASRRKKLSEAISPYEQVIITTTDWGYVEPSLLNKATIFHIKEGNIFFQTD